MGRPKSRQKVAEKRNEIVKSFVEERIKTDVEFAKDVLKAVGEDLPEHLKKAAEETIKNSSQINVENVLMINNNLLPNTTTISPMLIEKEILNDGTLAKLANDAIKGKLQVNPNTKTSPGRIYPSKIPYKRNRSFIDKANY